VQPPLPLPRPPPPNAVGVQGPRILSELRLERQTVYLDGDVAADPLIENAFFMMLLQLYKPAKKYKNEGKRLGKVKNKWRKNNEAGIDERTPSSTICL